MKENNFRWSEKNRCARLGFDWELREGTSEKSGGTLMERRKTASPSSAGGESGCCD